MSASFSAREIMAGGRFFFSQGNCKLSPEFRFFLSFPVFQAKVHENLVNDCMKETNYRGSYDAHEMDLSTTGIIFKKSLPDRTQT